MSAVEKSPNVVVVMTTQWRAQSTGYAGDGNAVTPCLDSLAEEAIDFYQAVTPHPFGVFARSAFLTGTACPSNGICDYYDPLPKNSRTLAHCFGERGYDTAFWGKWQLHERTLDDPVVGEAHAKIEVPHDRRGGFGFWEGFESGFLLNDGFYHGSNLGAPKQLKGYQSDVIVDRAIDYLDTRDSGNPFFAFLSLDAPHPPYAEDAAGVSTRAPETILLDENVPEEEIVRTVAQTELAGYYAHIEATDRSIGRLIDRFKQKGEWENTLFVFTSAHGDMHGSHGVFRKGWPYDEAVRIPLLVSWSSGLGKARRDPLLVNLLDIGPSLLGLAFGESISWEEGDERGRDWSSAIRLEAIGPEFQSISMPSVPPFEKQCPYVWQGRRTIDKTMVETANGDSFTLDH
jgi:arylsulfatase A-like enzyme